MKIAFLSRWMPGLIRRRAIPILSVLILSILIPQFAISVLGYPIRQNLRRSWPFLDYPMYSHPRYEGQKISRIAVIGVRDEQDEVLIEPRDLGVTLWFFMRFVRALQRNEKALVQDFVQLYEERQGTRLSGIRLEDRGMLFSKNGLNPAPTEVLADWPLAAPQDN